MLAPAQNKDNAAPSSAVALAGAHTPQTLLRFLTCGSVDDGKSTLIGRLLYECGSVFDDQLAVLAADSEKYGTDGNNLDFALLVDGLSAEREQGITIDVAYRYFSSRRRAFIVADTPGHEQYTRNMATGASTADLAILLVDARKGLLVQTRRHAFIASMLRIPHVVLAVNKMDLVDYDRSEFDRIEKDFRAAVADLDFAHITAIPLSARCGDNIVLPSPHMPWYQGQTLLDYLETVETGNPAQGGETFLFPVQWVNRPDASFRGFAGTVAAGSIQRGAQIKVLPGGQRNSIARIVSADGDMESATAGQAITLVLGDEIDVSRGDVLTGSGSAPAAPVLRARVNLIWTGSMPARDGETYIVQVASAQTQAQLVTIHYGLDVETYTRVATNKIAMNGVGLVTLEFSRALVITDYAQNRVLGGLVLIDRYSNETVAIGLVDQRADVAATPISAPAGGAIQLQLAGLRRWFERRAGVAGSVQRSNWFFRASWRVASAILVAVAAGGLASSFRVAFFAGLADILLRPLMHRWHRAIWRKNGDGGDINLDGGGI